MMVRLVHTADLQLGKPFGRFPDQVRAALTEARFDVIDTIGQLAGQRGIAHVVVAGDVFDSAGPADRDVVQAITRMGRANCRWWLLPGNHDYARADGFWARVRARAPGNVAILDQAAPVEMEDGVWLLPAPLEYRRTKDDPTTGFSKMETPAGALRIGLAHGSVVDFGAKGESENFIPADRAQQSGLDYLALGDWHGHLTIGDRTAYSGASEADRFGRDDTGSVIVADIRPGRPPALEKVHVGRFRWLQREWVVNDLVDFERELRDLRATIDPASTLLQLELTGTSSLADRVAMRGIAEDDLAHALRWLGYDDDGLTPIPTKDDIGAIDMQGVLAAAAARLSAAVETGGSDGALAARALERLYVEAIRANGEVRP